MAALLELAVANARIAVGSVLRRGAPFAALALVAVGAVALRRRAAEPVLVGTLAAGAIARPGACC